MSDPLVIEQATQRAIKRMHKRAAVMKTLTGFLMACLLAVSVGAFVEAKLADDATDALVKQYHAQTVAAAKQAVHSAAEGQAIVKTIETELALLLEEKVGPTTKINCTNGPNDSTINCTTTKS